MSNFPERPIDGALAEVLNEDGSAVQYKYDKSEAAWKIVGKTGDELSMYITTADVVTTSEQPTFPTGFNGLKSLGDIQYLTNQKLVNWTLADAVIDLQDVDHTKVYYGDSAPEEGHTYEFWFKTDELELYVLLNGEWVVSTTPTLDRVLENGNTATKGILLKGFEGQETVQDFISLAPEASRIIVAARSDSNLKPTFELIESGDTADTNRRAEFELDEKRLDINMDEMDDEIHFRFDDDEELVLRHRSIGPSEFKGKVVVEPGTEGHQVVTYGQLASIEEELEQLAPSLERGSWAFTLNNPPGVGQYTMIKASLDEDAQELQCDENYAICLTEAAGDPAKTTACNRAVGECKDAIDGTSTITTDEWEECQELVFNDVDSNGTNHGWAGIDSDHYIDVFNADDANFMVGDITTHGGGRFQFDLISSRGVASGLATIKIFKAEGTVGLDQYVRKTGDTMTGPLIVEDPTENNHAVSKQYADSLGTLIGSIVFWGGTRAKIPAGWTECNGSTLSTAVKDLIGMSKTPDLRNYMPAGDGGSFGSGIGTTYSSRIRRHTHTVSRLEPGNTTGDPNGSSDTSSTRYRYWRGNSSSNQSGGSDTNRTSSQTGENITAPPCYIGVWIMKIS